MSLRTSANGYAVDAVRARRILDSRGRPTVEVDVTLAGGVLGRAAVPSGASTGAAEAHELRDRDPGHYGGRDVTRAIANVNTELAAVVRGADARDQTGVDRALREIDGTDSLSRLGANAVLGVSLAVARAAASAERIPLYVHLATLSRAAGIRTQPVLPVPMVNLFSGGLHAGKGMDIQDFLVVPLCADTYPEALEIIWRLREAASELLGRRGMTTLLADEGGLSPGFTSGEDALQATVETIELAGLVPGRDAGIALDVAATGLWHADDGLYHFARAQRQLSGDDITTMLEGWVRTYPIVSIEDPLHDEDWAAWSTLTSRLPGVQVVGDDLFATNAARIQRGVRDGAGTCALIKVNQNGTLSGTLEALRTAQDGRFSTVVSARSGETEDAFIADLAAGTGCGQIKIGSLRSSERLSKYNQLSRLSELVGPRLAPDALQRLRAAGAKTAQI